MFFTRLFVIALNLPELIASPARRKRSGRKSFTIESAWLEKGEAAPGETLRVRVLLGLIAAPPAVKRPAFASQSRFARGTNLRILVSDADLLNRASRGSPSAVPAAVPMGLDQLIHS